MKKLRNLLMILVVLLSFKAMGQTVFYTQDFETTNDWSITPATVPSGNNTWIWGSGTTTATTGSMTHSGYGSLQIWDGSFYDDYYNWTTGGYTKQVSKTFNLSSLPPGNVIQLSFYTVCRGEPNYDDMRVMVNGVQIGTAISNQTTWTQKFIDLTTFAGQANVTVSFQWRNDGSITRQPAARLDDIKITYYNPLPVELLYFTSTCDGDKVILNWSTASEQHSDKFIVQKSRDLERWSDVSVIKAQGNSNTKKDYSVTDLSWSGIYYYRLKQTDFNGDYEIYGPISSECTDVKRITLFPNPNNGSFRLNSEEEKLNIVITDNTGRIVYRSLENSFELINTNLPNGYYNINLFNLQGIFVNGTNFCIN